MWIVLRLLVLFRAILVHYRDSFSQRINCGVELLIVFLQFRNRCVGRIIPCLRGVELGLHFFELGAQCDVFADFLEGHASSLAWNQPTFKITIGQAPAPCRNR